MGAETQVTPRNEVLSRKGGYDAAVVLAANIRQSAFRREHPLLYPDPIDTYLPTDYRHHDQFGMLGGNMRILAATELVLQGATKRIVFTGGRSKKIEAALGPEAPAEAEVYKRRFLRVLEIEGKGRKFEPPKIEKEERSANTVDNLREILLMTQERGWRTLAIVSNNYHIPRVKDLWKTILEEYRTAEKVSPKLQVTFIKAEDYLKEHCPGKFDSAIDIFDLSEHAVRRRAYETNGHNDYTSGGYHRDEFQFASRSDDVIA